MIIVLDSSVSIGAADFGRAKAALTDMTSLLNIGHKKVHKYLSGRAINLAVLYSTSYVIVPDKILYGYTNRDSSITIPHNINSKPNRIK